MRVSAVLFALGAAWLLSACASSSEPEWMRLDGKYTTDDFRRDHTACSKKGKLDEECMKSRGWVAVRPSVGDKAPERDPRGGPAPATPTRRY